MPSNCDRQAFDRDAIHIAHYAVESSNVVPLKVQR